VGVVVERLVRELRVVLLLRLVERHNLMLLQVSMVAADLTESLQLLQRIVQKMVVEVVVDALQLLLMPLVEVL
jgi:hypothetical protein